MEPKRSDDPLSSILFFGQRKTRRLGQVFSRREPAARSILPNLQIFRRLLALVRHNIEGDLGTLVEAIQAGSFDCRNMHEDILAAVVGLNKSIALGRVEPLHSTCRHVRSPF